MINMKWVEDNIGLSVNKKIVVSLFVIGLLILGCIFDNDDQSSDDSFSLNVNIVDEHDVPVPNLNVTFLSPIELPNNQKSRAQTTISFVLAETCFVTIIIEETRFKVQGSANKALIYNSPCPQKLLIP